MSAEMQATVDDLRREPGKAELVHGQVVRMNPAGYGHNRAAGAIYLSLRQYEANRDGVAVADNAGFIVELPHRGSFSPDVAYYFGPLPENNEFLPQAPEFAVEVRSPGDYGKAAEVRLAEKRADYFAAGTQVVWDVDLTGDDVIRAYRSDDPTNPTIHRRGETADAEPAVPGWTMPVDELFR